MQLVAIEIFVLIVYLSILVELVLFPVPSVASTWQLLSGHNSSQLYGLRRTVQSWHPVLKILLLFIPTAISVVVYCFPLLLIIVDRLQNMLVDYDFFKNSYATTFGITCIVLGRIIALYSVIVIRGDNSQKDQDFSLKTTGIFRISRNPILMGMYLTILGLFLLFPYRLMIPGIVIYFANMHFRIKLEEDFLKEKFGDRFTQYMNSTNRYI